MPEALRLLLIAAVFGLLVYLFFRALFGTSAGYHEPPEPMDASGWTLVVDGSNFAHHDNDVRLSHLEDVVESLEHYFKDARVRVFCDANLRHKFGDQDARRFEQRVNNEADISETHGQSADDVILKYASDHPRCIVVSNDRFSKGDEIEMRQDVPLLRIERPTGGRAFPHSYVDIFDNPNQPDARKRVAVRDLVES
jgi:rRNA-processing protein FCF1